MSARHLRWGLVAVGLYLAAGLIPASMGVPVLPLFDGLAPPEPYRWVEAPPDAIDPIGEPFEGEDTIPVDDNFGAFTVITADGQAQATMLVDAVELPPGEEAVHLTVTPVDPMTLGPPPAGLRFDSNAYTVEAEYVPSGDAVTLTGEATILLRYAIHAEEMLRWGGQAWQPLETTLLQGTLQVFANTSELGAFVAAGPDLEESGPGPALWIGLGAGAMALIIGLEVFLRRQRRKRRPGKRAKPGKGGKAKGRKKAGKGR
jgi:hypothetical protein